MTTKRRVYAATAGFTFLLGCAVPALAATKNAPQSPEKPVPTVVDFANAIDAVGHGPLASVYDGLRWTDDQTGVVVTLSGPSPNAEAQIRAIAQTMPVSFDYSSISEQQLMNIASGVESEVQQFQQATGVTVSSVYPDDPAGTVVVWLVGETTVQSQAWLSQHFGLRVLEKAGGPVYYQTTTSRVSDSTPWNGGDSITGRHVGSTTDYGGCSNGFNVYYPSGTTKGVRGTTAAHCYDVGYTVYNTAQHAADQTASQVDTSNPIGKVLDRSQYSDPDTPMDYEVFTVSSTHLSDGFWRGAIGNTSGASVYSYSSQSQNNTHPCADGAYGGESCTWTAVTNASGCIETRPDPSSTAQVQVCHIVQAYDTAGDTIDPVKPGDSGGPVFRLANGQTYAAGIVESAGYAADGTPLFAYTGMDSILQRGGYELCSSQGHNCETSS